VDVDGGRHTADHVVLANGADPIVPPVPGLRELEGIWTNREITGIWQLTHAGKYRGEVAASNILGEPREANYEAVPRVVLTDPRVAAVGATVALKDVRMCS
jgi:pyruvate/2-oxoglutarate dehydrogenase complex dihydrolipoamide dehydrogenase (E3) component